jgi:hypothetical protein
MASRQAIAERDLRVAGVTSAERAALAQQFRARHAMDCTVDAAAAQQRSVGGVHDGVERKGGDIRLDGTNCCRHESQVSAAFASIRTPWSFAATGIRVVSTIHP